MKQLLPLIAIFTTMDMHAQIQYPVTEKETITDDYFGTKVEDPYRWLEDDNAETTKKWVIEQNKVTDAYLSKIPFRDKIEQRLEKLWNYPKFGAPFKKGDWYYYFKNDGLQNQSVMYRTKDLSSEPEVFIDPNTLSTEGIVALSGISFSKSGKLLAYSISKAGSDWQEIFLMDVESKKLLSDKIEWTKFGGAAWKGEEGFYYSAYDKPDETSKLSKANEFQKVYYHKMGTAQSEDQLIYQDKEHPKRYYGCGLTEDERFLILNISEGTSGGELWYRDLKDDSQTEFELLVKGFDTESDVIENNGDKLLVKTNYQAPNYRVVIVDPKNPARENWKTIIAEQKEVLLGVGTGGGNLFTNYLKDASSRIYQYDYNGKQIREIKLPGIGSAGGFGADKDDKYFYYSYSSYATPPSIYKYDIASGKSELYKTTEINMSTADIVTEQIFFTSKNGTKVPMFLTYKKGLKKDGNNPVLLYGYGGFNIPMTPGFSVSNTFFVEQGGIYVVVNLRGGNEYGEKWHKAGMLLNKQNVFDDFIGAAEYLIKSKYTNNNKIAVRGGSNGGLLVGAVMTQRPDLFKVAIPQVGVLDMLRYHKFTVGWGWAVEYGSSDSAKYFPYLYKYSPYHNLKKGTSYPATIVTTGDHDDRVVPAHSFKFAARLQEYHKGENPVLIRIETNAGHGAGKPTSKVIEEAADIWAFTMYNLGMGYKE
ncbi:prolyl oligopeptidase family serine peptidase [Niabella ginsengisoli]|uniref:prolyl oligopeptidase n=1 Tax=Niabella ginsengisoli TaxID=522298 RepID=A0ABS9SL14_9BACT|nr:prolyl oligopeptidase family serine peptidase [Niabella ginsengisoli]MCH5599030.1 prolyl oligopeptidase family serine peptidase [Niabella ginsengisoli]